MKVFLSSTAQDLEAYRRVADDTILRLAQQSVAMERFGPLPDTPVEECERLARESDVLVCIVAYRYGFVPEKGRGSITHREIEAAYKAGKDVLVWIVADDYGWTEKKEQDLLADPSVVNDPKKIAEIMEGVAGLIQFKAWLRTIFTPETFTTSDDLGRKIAVALGNYLRGHATAPIGQDRISISRLPSSGSELFGRETELQILDDAWANAKTNIVSFVAWGGVGKTALVNHWLKRRMARDNYRGAVRVYGWSFFSQGTSDRAASADLFIDQALRWYGDADPTLGSPWDKGERLARYIRHSRTLLILDGLEPLQHPPGFQEGRLKDAAMQALLVELAAQQPGLCVISTRERIGDLVEFEYSTVSQRDLDYLSPQAGAQVLRSLNVKGDDEELEEAAKELRGHAFSLTLLGSYLDEVLNGDIRRRKEIENLFHDSRYGDAAQRMIAAYEKRLSEGRELAILRLLGFFDRPADLPSLTILRQPPPISGLTEPLQQFKAREWNQSIAKLRRTKLIAEASPSNPGALDAHPLVREYFKQRLKQEFPDAWREANLRLYEYLIKSTKELPETIEEMSPLYVAVSHGCAAGRYREAVLMHLNRIQRGEEHFNWHNLGAFGADLSALSNFFEGEWDRPRAELMEIQKGLVLNDAGYDLQALGRLQEAIQPIEAGLDIAIRLSDWRNASIAAHNLSTLFVTLGNLAHAIQLARQSIELADRSEDELSRVICRATLGYALHQAGKSEAALAAFNQAEDIQRLYQPETEFLYSFQGFHYCELLVEQGRYDEVKSRAIRALEIAKYNQWLLEIGSCNLTLGRAWTLEAKETGRGDAEALEFLQQAVKGLRQAGTIAELPRGLLARAEIRRVKGEYLQAKQELAEVLRIATRGGMGLYVADYHLESARLFLAEGNRVHGRDHLAAAKEMIDRMGYHRRDKEVSELEAQLA